MAGTRNLAKHHNIGGRAVQAHVLIAEKALGRRLPPGAEVHHVDLDPTNNNPSNLVICPSHAYHMLLHARARAMAACGNPDYRKCQICKEYVDPKDLQYNEKRRLLWHKPGMGCKRKKLSA